jgi:hypothetical protein
VTIKEGREISSDDAAEGGGRRARRSPQTTIEFRVGGGLGVAGSPGWPTSGWTRRSTTWGNNLMPEDPFADRDCRDRRHDTTAAPARLGGRRRTGRPGRRPAAAGAGAADVAALAVDRGRGHDPLRPGPSPRGPRPAIKRLRGRFSLALGGTRRTVTVDKPVSRLGQDIDDPALKEAGVRVALVRRHGSIIPDDKALFLRVNGKGKALGRVRVLSADGSVVGSGFIDADGEDGRTTA